MLFHLITDSNNDNLIRKFIHCISPWWLLLNRSNDAPNLHASAKYKADLFRERYNILLQRTSRHSLFSPPVQGASTETQGKKFQVRKIIFLFAFLSIETRMLSSKQNKIKTRINNQATLLSLSPFPDNLSDLFCTRRIVLGDFCDDFLIIKNKRRDYQIE